MKIKGISHAGERVLAAGQPIIIGISLNNSYFKEENITKLLMWAKSASETIYIMIPDKPSVYTLVARGQTQKDAENEARLKGNNLENKCRRIASLFDIQIHIVRWDALYENTYYLEALAEIDYLYKNDTFFKDAVRQTTREVLATVVTPFPQDKQVDIGIQFFLQELAFISFAPLILGVEKIAYVYHRETKVLRDLLGGSYNFKPNSVGHIVVV